MNHRFIKSITKPNANNLSITRFQLSLHKERMSSLRERFALYKN